MWVREHTPSFEGSVKFTWHQGSHPQVRTARWGIACMKCVCVWAFGVLFVLLCWRMQKWESRVSAELPVLQIGPLRSPRPSRTQANSAFQLYFSFSSRIYLLYICSRPRWQKRALFRPFLTQRWFENSLKTETQQLNLTITGACIRFAMSFTQWEHNKSHSAHC